MPLHRPSEATKLLLCVAILVIGLVLVWRYVRRSASSEESRTRFEQLLGDRPWRRLGAAISAVLAVMFVAGVYVVDIPDRPVPYAAYWIVMMGLVVWLCTLAVKDALHTRRMVNRWREERAQTQLTDAGRENRTQPAQGIRNLREP